MQFLPAIDPGPPMPQAAHGANMTAVPAEFDLTRTAAHDVRAGDQS